MTDLESYLSSEQAERDVAALLAQDLRIPIVDAVHDCATMTWMLRASAAWNQVTLRGVMHGEIVAYFRPDAPGGYIPDFLPARRYIVTDLGEAVRALRLRTGCAALLDRDLIERLQAGADPRKWLLWPDGVIGRVLASSADLPSAICHVLIAAHRVAHLEISP